jgi:hypothetical protein
VYLAFFLGFCQALIAMVVEVLVILFLASQVLLTDVIMKFVALAAIVKFDDMYAGALYDEKMKKATKKLLPMEYKRFMSFKTQRERDEHNTVLEQSEKKRKLDFHGSDPKINYLSVKFLRFVHKTIRIFYVSWNYYFTPFLSLFVTFSLLDTMGCDVINKVK